MAKNLLAIWGLSIVVDEAGHAAHTEGVDDNI